MLGKNLKGQTQYQQTWNWGGGGNQRENGKIGRRSQMGAWH
jgi:hypothetical protein